MSRILDRVRVYLAVFALFALLLPLVLAAGLLLRLQSAASGVEWAARWIKEWCGRRLTWIRRVVLP